MLPSSPMGVEGVMMVKVASSEGEKGWEISFDEVDEEGEGEANDQSGPGGVKE